MLKSSLILTLLLSLAAAPAAAALHGRASLEAGRYEHPLGLRLDDPAGYLGIRLIATESTSGRHGTLKLGYDGALTRFDGDSELGSDRHALGLEWYLPGGVFSAGVQGSLRRNRPAYELYDYAEGYGYLAVRRALTPRLMLHGFAALRWRDYGDLPEESFAEPHARLELQHYSESRTTLGLALSVGRKTFNDPVASRVWDTSETPAASRLAARLSIAQGLSERVSLRAWVEAIRSLEGFPHTVSADVFDSPLLDRYAYEGGDAGLILKALIPWQTWAELGGTWGRHDYGDLVFDDGGDGAPRTDTVLGAFLGLSRVLGGSGKSPRLGITVGWRDQDSDVSYYDCAGLYLTSSLIWRY